MPERDNLPIGSYEVTTNENGDRVWTCPRGHENSPDTMICLGCLF